jgi:hypothetical protein
MRQLFLVVLFFQNGQKFERSYYNPAKIICFLAPDEFVASDLPLDVLLKTEKKVHHKM